MHSKIITIHCKTWLTALLPLLVATCSPRKPSQLKNTDNSPPKARIQHQRLLGSCASFGALSLLELDTWVDQGVDVDLSERYMIRANLLEKNKLSMSMQRWPQRMTHIGTVPETRYPYQAIQHNKALIEGAHLRRNAHILRHLVGNESLEQLQTRLRKLPPKRRRAAIEHPLVMGTLGGLDSDAIVRLPVKVARIQDSTKITRVNDVPCFATATDGNHTAISPQRFLSQCLKFRADAYLGCGNRASRTQPKKLLRLITQVLDAGGYAALSANIERQEEPFFRQATRLNTAQLRHAMTVVGYVSRDEFHDANQHRQGWLKGSQFDEIELLAPLNHRFISDQITEAWKPVKKSRAEAKTRLDNQRITVATLKVEMNAAQFEYEDASKSESTKLYTIYNTHFERYADAIKHFNAYVATYNSRVAAFAPLNDRVKKFNAIFAFDTLGNSYPFSVTSSDKGGATLYQARLQAIPSWTLRTLMVPKSPAERFAWRRQTRLGQLITQEEGILILKNSWGPAAGVRGYFYMSFRYFKKRVRGVLLKRRLPMLQNRKTCQSILKRM